ncbi:MAG: Mu transposase C-terminal domain-containing protein [Ruminococcus sp.]|nr:Mu transposase C-terminal domain-containing protein [Ruminococcus sp.]
MDYLSVQETAELKGCSERYIKKICKDGKLNCSIEINDKNRPKYMIPISALSEDLQKKYYAQKRIEAGVVPVKTAVKHDKNRVLKSFEDYSGSERSQIVLWKTILDDWQSYRDSYPNKKTEVDQLYVSKLQLEYPDIQISIDTLYRKLSAYRKGDLQGLCENRGGWNKGQSQIPKEVWEQFCYLYLSENKPTVSRCYELTRTWTMEYYPDLVSEIPCERSFRRHIKSEIPQAVLTYLRDGDKAMKDKCLPYISRMYDKLHANDVWIADNHTFDIQSFDEVEGTIHRLYLTAFLDAKSGVLVGWNVCQSPNSQSTILALRHGIKRFGIPKAVYFDNGREFLTHDVGGKGHRRRKTDNDDIEPPTILKRLGIEMHNAIVRNAKAKPIERTFSTLTMQFARMFEGYCGGTIMQRPESLKRRIKDGKIPCDFEIREFIDEWIDGDFNVQKYGGSESTFKGMSRIDVWNRDIKTIGVRRAPESELNLMLMRSTRIQKVKRNGVFVDIVGEKLWFMDENMTYKHLGEEVYVRYDPADLRSVRIYDKDDRYLWTWECADKLLVDYITDNTDEISDAMSMQRKTQKFIKAEAKAITDGMSNSRKIDLYAAAALKSSKGKDKFKIIMPSNVIMIKADEPEAQELPAAVGYEVDIDINKMNKNIERRKRSD